MTCPQLFFYVYERNFFLRVYVPVDPDLGSDCVSDVVQRRHPGPSGKYSPPTTTQEPRRTGATVTQRRTERVKRL